MPTASDPQTVVISRVELLGLTFGMWIGGVSILTLLPLLLIPRLGLPTGTAVAYLVFFLAWQPVQSITQRVLGVGPALVRMLAFVGGGAMVAYFLREALVAASRAG
jgi:hypothetical protein